MHTFYSIHTQERDYQEEVSINSFIIYGPNNIKRENLIINDLQNSYDNILMWLYDFKIWPHQVSDILYPWTYFLSSQAMQIVLTNGKEACYILEDKAFYKIIIL